MKLFFYQKGKAYLLTRCYSLFATILLSMLLVNISYASPQGPKTKQPQGCYDPQGFLLSADFIYLKAISESTSFVFKTNESLSTPNSGLWGGKSISPCWEYDPGVRISATFPVFWGGWRLSADWSFFENKSKKISLNTSGYSLYSQPASPGIHSAGNLFANQAKGLWRLTSHIFDFYLNHPIKINNTFEITPRIGVEGAIIRQKIRADYSDFLISNLVFNDTTPSISYKNSTWGVGSMVGLETVLKMPALFSLHFLTQFSMLSGESKARTRYDNTPSVNTTIKNSLSRIFSHSTLQASLQKTFNISQAHLGLALGWEAHVFSKQLGSYFYGNITSGEGSSDLMVYGMFARALVGF